MLEPLEQVGKSPEYDIVREGARIKEKYNRRHHPKESVKFLVTEDQKPDVNNGCQSGQEGEDDW